MVVAKALTRGQEADYVDGLVSRIVRECPRRQPTSEDELRGHLIMRGEFDKLGLDTRFHHFRFNDNLYKNLALHFGLGVLGTMVSGVAPMAGFALHLGPSASYWADSTRRGYYLRRLFEFKPSQNLLAVLPAEGEPALRIVLAAHIDAAFTGLLFDPKVLNRFTREPPAFLSFTKRSLAMATRTQASLAGFDLLRAVFGPILTLPLRPIETLLTIPSALAFALNLQVLIRNEIVPGAMDDLSGVAALPLLARRLAKRKRRDVEIVLAVTGCEEASLGGADALARDMEGVWDKDRTVIIGLDGICNGDLRFLEIEGEVVKTPVPAWLGETVRKVAASEPRFAEVTGFEVPVGGSDVAAFLARGWQGVCLACVDPEIGAPRHYHQPSDSPENLETDKIIYSIDFTEKLVRAVIRRRLARKKRQVRRNSVP
ncbi:MAG: Zn-dependent exopeptidase M28 [Deltaproteobacteria bacterium]|nr:Zn-dependent exopeptidase M28 [Deltaproteobacteria bacterium]